MPSPILWDTLLRSKKALPRAWNQLPPEIRRKCFVGDSFNSFKLWKKLEPKVQVQIKEKLHFKKDVEKICKCIQKWMKAVEKENKLKEENTMSSKSKSSKKSSKKSSTSSKSNKSKSTKSNKEKTVKKVVPIVDYKKVDCPQCEVKKGHRCIFTTTNKAKHQKAGGKREQPHRARVQKAMKPLKRKAA